MPVGCTYTEDMAVYSIPTYDEVTYGYVPTPTQRTLTIPAEDRTMVIEQCKDGG